MGQLSFSDIELGQSRKISRVIKKLDKIDLLVDCVILVFASKHYNEEDYIRDYNEFLEATK